MKTNKVEDAVLADKNEEHSFRLSQVKQMIDKALMKSKKRRDSQGAEMAEKTVFNAFNCVPLRDNKERSALQSRWLFVQLSVTFSMKVSSPGNMQKVAMKATVFAMMIKAVFGALMKERKLLVPIITFVANIVKKESVGIKNIKKI